MRVALSELGLGPVMHMRELVFPLDSSRVDTRGFMEKFNAMAKGGGDDWGWMEEFNSGVDWPLSSFPEELLRRFPDAKFILTIRRNGKTWMRSIKSTICRFGSSGLPWSLVGWLPVLPFSRLSAQREMLDNVMKRKFVRDNITGWEDLCGMSDEEGEGVYERWNEYVKRVVPSDRLLVFETGRDGYGEVMEFLGIEEKEGTGEAKFKGREWPRVNSKEEFDRIIAFVWLLAALEVGGVCWGIFKFIRSQRRKNKTA